MQSTGIRKKIDEAGRITLPRELRNAMECKEGDYFEILVENGDVILRKTGRKCMFLGESENLINYRGYTVSLKAVEEMAKLAGLTYFNED